jgi:hypothetical protein
MENSQACIESQHKYRGKFPLRLKEYELEVMGNLCYKIIFGFELTYKKKLAEKI